MAMRKMEVDKLGIDLLTQDPVVILRDVETGKYLPIIIGPFEATAIALALEGTPVPRPLSHDLMKNIVEAMNARVEKVVIHDIQNNTFLAKVYLEVKGEIKEVDARPSDSIALALRTDSPIYVSDKIILDEAVIDKRGEKAEKTGDKKTKEFKKFLETLKPSDFLKEEKENPKENQEEKDEEEDEDE